MPKKIIFVDDEPDVLSVAAFRLRKAGYEVTTADDGRKALELSGAIKPDLMLLDLHLPFLSGIEVCKKIKADEKLKYIPVILFTASTQDIEGKVSEAGADDYLFKPFNPELLLEKVRKFVG